MKKAGLLVTASFTLLSTVASIGSSVVTAAPDAARERLNNFLLK